VKQAHIGMGVCEKRREGEKYKSTPSLSLPPSLRKKGKKSLDEKKLWAADILSISCSCI